MPLHNAARYVKAQPEPPLVRVHVVRPEEALEQLRHVVKRDADTVVLHDHAHPLRRVRQMADDRPLCRVLQRIGQQVHKYLLQARRVAHNRPALALEAQVGLPRARHGPHGFQRRLDHLLDLDRLPGEVETPRLEASHVQQIVHQVGQPPDLRRERAQHPRVAVSQRLARRQAPAQRSL